MISNIINRLCKQTAVYWGTPTKDGAGGYTFDDPIEIGCRWEQKREIFRTSDGREETTRAVVFIDQDVDEQGYLYLGELDDLDSADEDNPKLVDDAFMIRRFDKSTELNKTAGYIRKVYL